MLHTQGPGENLRHHRVINKTGRQRTRCRLARRWNIGLWQAASGEESGEIGIRAPWRFWCECSCRCWVQLALQLRRKRDGRKVLELHVIRNAESAADRCFSISARVVSEPHTRCNVVLVRLRHTERDYARNIGDGVQGLRAVADRIRPILITYTKVEC